MRFLPALVSVPFLALATQAAHAVPLDGTWTGSGFVTPSSGQRERVSCRVSYSRQGPSVYAFSATCATASAKFNQSGQLTMVNESRYIGDFFNPEYNLSGRARVVVSGSRQTVTLSSQSGSGQLNLSKR